MYYELMGFKENLKAELQYKGILVKELATKSGIKKQTIDNYLSSHNSMPKADSAVQIAKALGTSVEFLITGYEEQTGDTPPPPQDLIELNKLYKKLSKEKQKLVLELVRNL